MPGFLGGGSSGGGVGGEIRFPTEFIDPVTKLRVSNPENLIDTDFEYGLQPTKWETLELINNTPSFFSKSGDTTIDNILSITTNKDTREIIVRTSQEHLLAVGIPINVQGSKSITADGAYIINSIPDAFTFTYLCKDVQPETAAIDDLYTSIITGEFFQGSQLRISDENGISTNAAGLSELTVTTATTHGFGVKTPFYFLNLNSAIAQEFQAANTAARAFDASNSATAQVFDGSNTLSSINIDFSNSGVTGGTVSVIQNANTINDTVTVQHTTETFATLPLGQPLYYNVVAGSGFFQANPRGVVFLKTRGGLGTTTSTFQVSETPDGPPIDITGAMTGTFQISARSITFAGNNRNPLTEITLDIERETAVVFDGGNQGFAGAVGSTTAPNGFCTVLGYTGDSVLVSVTAGAGLEYYPNAMVRYSSTGAAATGLTNNATFFIQSITPSATPNLFTLTLKAFPDSPTIISASGGTGTQTFRSIGVSIDKDIFHARNANFTQFDMVEYTAPGDGGEFGAESIEDRRNFYFVARRFDEHNFRLSSQAFIPLSATGGVVTQVTSLGRTFNVHAFTTVGTSTFTVTGGSTNELDVLIVAGGGGGGTHAAPSGGGAGGLIFRPGMTSAVQAYPIVVGGGGVGGVYQNGMARLPGDGGVSTAFGMTAVGGGQGKSWFDHNPSGNGGSGSGGTPASGPGAGLQPSQSGASGQFGFGFSGGDNSVGGNQPHPGAGGGGAGARGTSQPQQSQAGSGGSGRFYGTVFGTSRGQGGWFAGGGGGGCWGTCTGGGAGGQGGGGVGDWPNGGPNSGTGTSARGAGERPLGGNGLANTGGGGGGAGRTGGQASQGGDGGSGVVLVRYPITPQQPIVVPVATGGTITQTTVGNTTFRIHTFTTAGTSSFNVSNPGTVGEFECLVVGGGGGGGHDMGGGGGAGGFRETTFTPVSASYAVTVGAGGAGAPFGTNGPRGFNGANSSIIGTGVNIVTLGGGGGASDHDTANHPAGGVNNGSTVASGGGGSGGANNNNGSGYGGSRSGTGTPGQGFDGAGASRAWYPGGGGGAGQAGSNADCNPKGGDGLPSSILGTTFWFCGGGGGAGYTCSGGNGGRGGGGGGAVGSTSGGANSINAASGGGGGGTNTWAQTPGGNAAANSGGGGGGGAHNDSAGGAGGSGIVVIRYPIAIV